MGSVLFITDECEKEKEFSIKNRNSEGNGISAKIEMLHFLHTKFDNVKTTYSIEEATSLITSKDIDFVVTTYYGEAESDSKSIIPSVCKANNVKYLGADSYAHMICNDKYLSKAYIKHFGLTPTSGKIIYSPNNEFELNNIKKLQYPVIVKPNFGGGSNGIICNSVKYNYNDTVEFLKELYNYQNLPILVEEYIPGYEVSVIIIGNKKEILFCDESQLCLSNKEFFDKEVFGLESKKIDSSKKSYKESNYIGVSTKNKMTNLFKSFDKMEFMRIDCRIDKDNQIYILELSPDCYIGSKGAFFETVKRQGFTFDTMMQMLLNNSFKCQKYL